MSANQIVFDAEYTSQQVKNLERARSMLEEAIGILKKASAHEGWKCPEVRNISNGLGTINSRLGRLNSGMEVTARVLSNGMQRFQELESRSEMQVHSLSENLREKHGFTGSNYGQNDQTNLPVTLIPQIMNSITIANPILSLLDKKMDIGEAGLAKGGLSYIASLYNFFTGDKRGLTGAADLFDLSDKSIGLWTKWYDYIKGKDTLSRGLGIAGSSFGLVSSTLKVVDKINSGNLGPAGVAGEVIGLGDSALDIWESIEKLKHVGDATPNFIDSGGLYSPLTLWSAFGKTVVATGSQTFKSVEKYSADGKWDLSDTGRTGIESGVAGLYSMFNALSLGGLSELGKVTGFTPENISTDIENWSHNLGKSAGNYIVNNPSLYEAYNNSGSIGKTIITFHAAAQSGIQSAVEGIGNWIQSLFH